MLLIVTFFVTSSDPGSLVIDSLAAGGSTQTPAWQRIFWSTTEGVVAAVLLLAGGLKALQTMAVATALPFAVIMLIAAVGVWRALVIEGHREASLQAHMQAAPHGTGALWKKRLAGLVNFPPRAQVEQFLTTTVVPAMQRVRDGLVEHEWPAEVHYDKEGTRAWIEAVKPGQIDFLYEIRLRPHPVPDFAFPEMDRNPEGDEVYYRAEVFLRRGGQSYDIYGYGEQEIIRDILDQFEKYPHFLHISPGSLPWNMAEHDEMLTQTEPEHRPQ